MAKIIITGGCGFIGSALVERLNSKKIIPAVIDIKQPPRSMRELKFVYKNTDIADKSAVISRLFKATGLTVVHLAAEHYIPRCEKYPQRCFRTNVYGTYHIANLIRRSRESKVIFTSSGAVYQSSTNRLNEQSIVRPDDTYGETKRLGENIVCSHLPGRYKIFRVFNVYGPGDRTPHLIPSIISQLKTTHAVELGNLKTKRDYIFIDDVISVIMKELIRERPGLIYNVGTGVASSAEQIVAIFEKLLGRRRILAKSKLELQRIVDRPCLVSNPTQIQNDYGISHFISLEQGLSLLAKNTRI